MNATEEKGRKETELRPQGSTVFALDIGTRTVVGIIGEYIDDKFRLTGYVSVPHTKRAMVDGQVEDIKQTAKIVAQVKDELEHRTGIKLERVSIAAAGRALKTARLSVDFDVTEKETITEDDVKSMEIEAVQRAQAQLDAGLSPASSTIFYCVGYSIVTYRLDDYKMISLEGHKGDTAQVELIAAFLPSIVVESLYTVMDLNKLEVSSLTLEPIAAMNVIVPPEIRLINIALVDIGAGTSDIAIVKDGTVCAYAMATTAGDEITEELIRTYLVDFKTAETLKQSCSAEGGEIEFRDILGVTHTMKASEIYQKLVPTVEVLADTICTAILEVNGGSPAAVFLVGGGSLIEGLPALVAEKLKLPESRVAIGGGDFLKNVDEQGAQLGAEFVTPLGIAVTSGLSQGYDFSVITVNDKKVRAFDTKQLSVFEALRLAGYKSADIMGRSGLNLTFTLNGKRITKKGGGFTPSEVYVNEKPASVTSKVTQGDRIRFEPAVCGENAAARL
ncbi:MAG: rod shape-determining protein, partial [Eubacterium sp.]|nr:rod shape-determining protein [Eubacterium sp.]